MKNGLTVSLVAVSLLASGSAFAQSAYVTDGMPRGALVVGPSGEVVGRTVVAPVGAVEVPTGVITSVEDVRAPSVMIEDPVVVGEPLPPAVEMRPVPGYVDYRYAVVNSQRVIIEPRTRRVVRVLE
jgi:hypothetical protein